MKKGIDTMRTETIYICDYCGKTFDDYEECCIHEMEESAKELNGVKFFDDNGKRLPPNIDPEKIYYIELTAENAKAVDKYFKKNGYNPPSEEVDTRFGGQFYWIDDEWRNVEYLRKMLAEIEEVFREKE